MKKIILLAAIAVFGFTTLNAQDETGGQTSKGSWMFGGDTAVSFASNTLKSEFDGDELDGKTTITTFTVNPNANYFVMDNLAVGIDLVISTSKTKYDEDEFYDDEFKSTSIAAIPNATYFFNTSNTVPYLGAGVGLLSSCFGSDDSDKFSGLAIMAKGGIMLMLNRNAAVNFGVDFLTAKLSNKEESDYKEKTNTIGVGVGFSIFI